MPDQTQLALLLQALNNIADGLGTISSSLLDLKNGCSAAFGALSPAINAIPGTGTEIDSTTYSALRDALTDPDDQAKLDILYSYYVSAGAVKTIYTANDNQVKNLLDSLPGTLDYISSEISDIADNIRTISGSIASALSGSGDLSLLISGISTLANSTAVLTKD